MTTAWNELVNISKHLHGRVLDAGCSNGDYTNFLFAMPKVDDVVSLDIQDINTPHHGKSFAETVPGGVFIQGDVQDLPFEDDSFDCILSWDMLQNVKDAPKAFREFARVTKRGGFVTVRTTIKELTPWVKSGVTVEKGSSGYTFVQYMRDQDELHIMGFEAGLHTIDYHVDPWSHQTFLFEVRK